MQNKRIVHEKKKEELFSRTKFRELLDMTLQDRSFRSFLESDPKGALASVGIDINDMEVLKYLNKHLKIGDESLLADGKGTKVFATASGVSIVAAVMTPAFPKGEEDEKSQDKTK